VWGREWDELGVEVAPGRILGFKPHTNTFMKEELGGIHANLTSKHLISALTGAFHDSVKLCVRVCV